jgi:L-rhamnose mutarotase
VGRNEPYVTHFWEIWSRVFEAFLRTAGEHERIVFAPELLSPANYYALRVESDEGDLVEAGDRWQQAFVLCELAAEAFTAAERRVRVARPRPRDYYEICTQLKPGAAAAYESFHRAIPRRLDESLRHAGVVSWEIYLRGDVLTHCVGVEDRERMDAILQGDATTPWWLEQANRFLLASGSPAVERPLGRLIWDLDWPTR